MDHKLISMIPLDTLRTAAPDQIVTYFMSRIMTRDDFNDQFINALKSVEQMGFDHKVVSYLKQRLFTEFEYFVRHMDSRIETDIMIHLGAAIGGEDVIDNLRIASALIEGLPDTNRAKQGFLDQLKALYARASDSLQ